MAKKPTQQAIKDAAGAQTDASALSVAAATEKRTDPVTLEAAVASLDPENDAHWTDDGEPRMEVLENLTGGNLTRDDVKAKFPDLTRANHKAEPPAPQTDAPADQQQQADEVAAAAAVDAQAQEAVESKPKTVEERLDALEGDQAFLRRQFGWPNKD